VYLHPGYLLDGSATNFFVRRRGTCGCWAHRFRVADVGVDSSGDGGLLLRVRTRTPSKETTMKCSASFAEIMSKFHDWTTGLGVATLSGPSLSLSRIISIRRMASLDRTRSKQSNLPIRLHKRHIRIRSDPFEEHGACDRRSVAVFQLDKVVVRVR
jgi:hypothetical protein